MSEANWFYARGQERLGPFSLDGLVAELRKLEDPRITLVWQVGLPGWAQAQSVPEVLQFLPPPIPLGAPSPEAPSPVEAVAAPPLPDSRYSRVGGWLAFFCLGPLVLNPVLTVVNLLSITDIAAHFETVPGLQAFIVSDAVLGVAVAVFGVWVGIRLVRVTPDAVRLATVYLAAYFGYVLFESVAPFGFGLPDAWSTELAKEVPKNLGRAGIYVGIWASYFKKSKRVAQTFGSQRGA